MFAAIVVTRSNGPVMPAGFAVGHWTNSVAQTGCTTVLAVAGAVGGVDVRGAAPATFGTDALRPATLVDRIHAILLTGGSAFGLAAATGVMDYLETHSVGYELASVRVPILAGAAIFDLTTGDPAVRPDRGAGYAACAAAGDDLPSGAIGAGTGATVAKGAGASQTRPGGLGVASAAVGDATVTAIVAVNSVGGVWDDRSHGWVAEFTEWDRASPLVAANTTIGVVLTDARLTTEEANRVATVAHDGIARAIRPSHTMYDGDTIFCLATGSAGAPYDAVEVAAADAVSEAIVTGVRAGMASHQECGCDRLSNRQFS